MSTATSAGDGTPQGQAARETIGLSDTPYRPPPGWEAATNLHEELFLRRVVDVLDARLAEIEARTQAEIERVRTETHDRLDAWKIRWRRRVAVLLAFLGVVNLAGAWQAYRWLSGEVATLQTSTATVRRLSSDAAALQAKAKTDVDEIHKHLDSAVAQMNGAKQERKDQERAAIDMMNGLSSAYRDMMVSSQTGVQSALARTVDLTRSVDTLSSHLAETRVASTRVLDSMRLLGSRIAANVDSLRGQVQGVWNVVLRKQPGRWQRIGLSGLEANVRDVRGAGRHVSLQIREPAASSSSIWETNELTYQGPDSVRWRCFFAQHHRYAIGIVWGIKQHQSIVFWRPNPYPDLVQLQLAIADGDPPPGSDAPHCPK